MDELLTISKLKFVYSKNNFLSKNLLEVFSELKRLREKNKECKRYQIFKNITDVAYLSYNDPIYIFFENKFNNNLYDLKIHYLIKELTKIGDNKVYNSARIVCNDRLKIQYSNGCFTINNELIYVFKYKDTALEFLNEKLFKLYLVDLLENSNDMIKYEEEYRKKLK